MRSRYTAYVTGNVNYIMKTTHPNGEHFQEDKKAWFNEVEVFCTEFCFTGLSVEDSDVQGEEGWVTFRANITRGGEDVSFTERSRFVMESGSWLYHSAVETRA